MMAETNGEPSSASAQEGVVVASASAPSVSPQPLPPTAISPASQWFELSNGGLNRNGTIFLKTKNYKAGSKINQLADMLARRSLQVVMSDPGDVNRPPPSLLSSPIDISGPCALTASPPLQLLAAKGPGGDAGLLPTRLELAMSDPTDAIGLRLLPPSLDLAISDPKDARVPCALPHPPPVQVPPVAVIDPEDDPCLLSPALPVAMSDLRDALGPCLRPIPFLSPLLQVPEAGDNLSLPPPPPAPGESDKTEEPCQKAAPEPMPPSAPSLEETPSPDEQVIAPPLTAFNDSENSTKAKPVKTRTSPRSRKDAVDLTQTDDVARRGKVRKSARRARNLVETSTQTADIQFITIVQSDTPQPASDVTPLSPLDSVPLTPLDEPGSERLPVFICLFCQLTFENKTDCLNHEATHSLKRKTKFIKCQFCLKKLPNLEQFKAHCIKYHGSNFHLCTECDLRFLDSLSLRIHAKVDHNPLPLHHVDKPQFTIFNKKVRTGVDMEIDIVCEGGKRSSISPRCPPKLSPKERTEEQLYEAEMLFYSHLSGNIQENLCNHLDGKIDQHEGSGDVTEPVRTSCLLAVVPVAPAAVPRAPSPYQTRSKTPNPLPTSAKKFKKLPNWQQKFWEKYNFPTNYRFEHRFWDKNYIHTEKSPLYLKDLSCLDIKTQLTMRENVKKLEEAPRAVKDDEERLKDTFPYFLNLVPGMEIVPAATQTPQPAPVEATKLPKRKGKPVRRTTAPQVVTRRRKGSLDLGAAAAAVAAAADQKMTLRRQTSLENLDAATNLSKDSSDGLDQPIEMSQMSGEWVRPRSYLCATCCAKFTSLWELEEHKWTTHPNVWCTHYEFEDDKVDKLFQLEADCPQVKPITLPDLYRRYLKPQGSLNVADTMPSTSFPYPCTKCSKACMSQPELHKHMLECGGDTTWFLTMTSSPATLKRRWRPYGSRRRKQIGQRGIKRNIPTHTTPTLRSYCTQPKMRTKPGDVESIQKMLANLPEKRTRRAINFDEVNTRSQTTIHSNRLLRKRLNASFGNNFLRRKVLKTVRQRNLKMATSAPGLESTCRPSSSEGSPSSSPRRRFRLKEVTVDVTPLALSPNMFPHATLTSEASSISAAVDRRRSNKLRPRKGPTKAEPSIPKPEDDRRSAAEAEIKIKKRIVARKGYLVKKIKNKLKNSKKLMESRRRSNRIKESQFREESAGEDELPIAHLNDPKKPKRTPVPEMPTLDREEPVKRRASRKSDPDLPVLNPEGPPLAVPAEQLPNVRFKVIKKIKKKKKKSSTISPLKLVKEPICEANNVTAEPEPREAVTKLVDNLTQAVSTNGESGSDSEPLIALKKLPSNLVARGKKRKKIGRKWSKMKRKVAPKVDIIVNTNTNASESLVRGQDAQLELSADPLVTADPSPVIETEVPTNPMDPSRFTNLMMERIIADQLVRRKKGTSAHKRANKHTLKRLRMTVTLKEATLKVLDKPTPTLCGPNKWTASAPVSDFIKLDTLPLAPLEDKSDGRQREQVVEQVAELDTVQTRHSRRPSQTSDEQDVKPAAPSPEVVQDVTIVETNRPQDHEVALEFAQPKQITIKRRKSSTWVEDVTTSRSHSKSTSEVPSEANDSIINSPTVLNNHWKSSEDVSTTMTWAEEKEAAFVACSVNDPAPIKNVIPMLTIEEATSSEDAMTRRPMRSPVSTCQAKIAEADSSVEDVSCEHKPSHDEPEMVVSSTASVVGKPGNKRRRKKQVVLVCSQDAKDEVPSSTLLVPEELDRRSRRKSKEVPTSNEFIIDDPLLLVDELWSDLDSDSDSKQKRKLKRVKKRTPKKKSLEVDLEALLRNFGENKEIHGGEKTIKCLPRRRQVGAGLTSRQRIEQKVVVHENAYKKLSLRLFSFNKKVLRYGHRGAKLLKVKKILLETLPLPKLPFLPSEVTENPEQVIVCRSTKVKLTKKAPSCEANPTVKEETPEMKPLPVPQLKVSLPLELLGDLSILDNNNQAALQPEPILKAPTKSECCSRPVSPDVLTPLEFKPKRSEVIDKIFYCEICKTYYYSPSQLKNHKISNRHKLKEAELLQEGIAPQTPPSTEPLSVPPDVDKGGDDSSEMPVLEGPFIETHIAPRSESALLTAPTHQQNSVLGFSEQSLKDIQKAIGCTDEEMLILTLLGENTVPEPDILDISNFTTKAEAEKEQSISRDGSKTNGTVQVDLKQRMTTALASLVNRAVTNLLNKSETSIKTTDRSDAVTFLNKLTGLSGRRTFLTPADLALDTSTPPAPPPLSIQLAENAEGRYQFKCTFCGNRFEKESTRDFHLVRTHRVRKRPKAMPKSNHEEPPELTPPCDDWNDLWYDADDFSEASATTSTPFWCSDCGINFKSPKEVLEHQRVEHPSEPPMTDVEDAKPPMRRCSGLDPDQERLLANQELQKLVSRKQSRRARRPQFGMDALKFTKSDAPTTTVGKPETRRLSSPSASQKTTHSEKQKAMDVYDFNEFDSDPEPMALTHVRKVRGSTSNTHDDDDSEDNIPLASVKIPRWDADAAVKPDETYVPPSSVASDLNGPLLQTEALANTDMESSNATLDDAPAGEDRTQQIKKQSFKISLENRFLCLDDIALKRNIPRQSVSPDSPYRLSPCSEEDDDSMPLFQMSRITGKQPSPVDEKDDEISENIIYHTNDSVSSFESLDESGAAMNSNPSDSDDSAGEKVSRTKRKIVPLLTATLTNSDLKSESHKLSKEVIVKKIWNRQKQKLNNTPRSEQVQKEVIMKRVWKKKHNDAADVKAERSSQDVKIKQTEFSDEVVIKCGPKTKGVVRRRSLNEPAKDAIVRRIWSGKCAFQTKAALKTYDSDVPAVITPPAELPMAGKRRGLARTSTSVVKRKKANADGSASEDDLESLLEEIEQENVEKAIRLEFLHLRRCEKRQVETPKEPPALFAEIQPSEVRNTSDKKRRKIRPSVALMKRRQELTDFRNRHHKKHRHRHHHHKHKHKKSHHHKRMVPKHRTRHGPEAGAAEAPFHVLERMCADIGPRASGGSAAGGVRDLADTRAEPRISADLDQLERKLDAILSPYETS